MESWDVKNFRAAYAQMSWREVMDERNRLTGRKGAEETVALLEMVLEEKVAAENQPPAEWSAQQEQKEKEKPKSKPPLPPEQKEAEARRRTRDGTVIPFVTPEW